MSEPNDRVEITIYTGRGRTAHRFCVPIPLDMKRELHGIEISPAPLSQALG